MSKAILLSVQPKWVEKIFKGEKTIEIRKTMPKCKLPIDVYIYCTKSKNDFAFQHKDISDRLIFTKCINGKVVAKFTLNEITELRKMEHYKATGLVLYKGAMNMGEFNKYGGKYAWHIENLKIFDEPKELSAFKHKKPSICGVKAKNGLYQCSKCRYGDSYYCECNIKITKAPQSWCYVEVE